MKDQARYLLSFETKKGKTITFAIHYDIFLVALQAMKYRMNEKINLMINKPKRSHIRIKPKGL